MYNLTLLAALAFGAAGTGAVVMAFFRRTSREKTASTRRALVLLGCGIVALFFGVLSALVHLHFGHGQHTPEPMALLPFFIHHKAYGFVAALALASFWGWAASSRRQAAS